MADDTLAVDDAIAEPAEPAESTGTKQEVYLGLLWLAITVFTAYSSLHGTPGATGPLDAAIQAMPDVVSTSLITAAAIAAAAASRRATALGRLLVGLLAGAGFGLVTAFGVRLAYGSGTSVTTLCVAVAAACVLGGAVAMLPGEVVDSSLWAMTWVLFAGLILNVLKPSLLTVLGGGPAADAMAQATAETRFMYLQPAVAGLLAAMHAVRWLRSADPALAWYPLTAALPGVYLLATEGLGHVAGRALAATPDGAAGQALLTDATKIRYTVIVLVVGGVLGLLIGARRPK
ncbi:hypothetical protein Cs7R123_56710 [Catellatospora sp. TT07R-123]|uniref:hypothetical protein n=1 Tax=Catellatospora sp. TT07R-123 TaxID=2733863 RepID=UPI001B00797E|nr:hypothetical protein [Catellatospora sp. TT07R-123]GHJ48329.1 hypothetical protein Cs7R123_56710 [Catellatospora sp. TT07R-123]